MITMRPLLKICGLMRPDDVRMCCQMGVDICGFVTEYPIDVPWNLTRKQCAELIQYISYPTKICIVTGGEREKIITLGRELRPDYIQLHYNETLEDVNVIVQALLPYDIKVVKTIPASEEERYCQFGTSNPENCAEKLCSTGVSVILVDSRGPSNAASSGSTASLPLYRSVKAVASCPVMLGGGITPDNCKEVIAEARPDILDVMTGAEKALGLKSEELVIELVKCLL